MSDHSYEALTKARVAACYSANPLFVKIEGTVKQQMKQKISRQLTQIGILSTSYSVDKLSPFPHRAILFKRPTGL